MLKGQEITCEDLIRHVSSPCGPGVFLSLDRRLTQICHLKVFCNALIPSGIAVLLASHTGGADVLLGAQNMRAATQYLGAFLGEESDVSLSCLLCSVSSTWNCTAASVVERAFCLLQCQPHPPQATLQRAVETLGPRRWGSFQQSSRG